MTNLFCAERSQEPAESKQLQEAMFKSMAQMSAELRDLKQIMRQLQDSISTVQLNITQNSVQIVASENALSAQVELLEFRYIESCFLVVCVC